MVKPKVTIQPQVYPLGCFLQPCFFVNTLNSTSIDWNTLYIKVIHIYNIYYIEKRNLVYIIIILYIYTADELRSDTKLKHPFETVVDLNATTATSLLMWEDVTIRAVESSWSFSEVTCLAYFLFFEEFNRILFDAISWRKFEFIFEMLWIWNLNWIVVNFYNTLNAFTHFNCQQCWTAPALLKSNLIK